MKTQGQYPHLVRPARTVSVSLPRRGFYIRRSECAGGWGLNGRGFHAEDMSPALLVSSAGGRPFLSYRFKIVERADALERRGVGQGFLDAEELVVLGDAVGAGGGAGFDLAGVRRHDDVGDGAVLGLAAAVRDDGGVACLLRQAQSRPGFRSGCRSG